MKTIFTTTLLLLSWGISALPSGIEFVKYIGYSKYHTAFKEVYDELYWNHRQTPNVEHYGDEPNGYFYEYDGAEMYFNSDEILEYISYTKVMPFGFKVGMKESAVEKKKKKLVSDFEKKKIKDQYAFHVKYDEKRLYKLMVFASYQLGLERSKGECENKGLLFPNTEVVRKYEMNVAKDLPYFTANNGICLEGDCKDGKGAMTWENEKQWRKLATFKGDFKDGNPSKGELTFTNHNLGKVKLKQVRILKGFLHCTSIIAFESGDSATIRFEEGGATWTSGLKFLDGKSISGALNSDYSYKIDNNESLITLKDGTVYKLKLDFRGKIQGYMYYPSGVVFAGFFDQDLRKMYGTLYDNKTSGTLSCDFSKYSSIKEAYWKYSDGTYRLGWFSVNEGFSGEVKTFYKNQISEYVVTGMFVKNKPDGKQVLYSVANKKTLSIGEFKNGILVSGVDVYNDPTQGLMGAKKQEKIQYQNFEAEYKKVLAKYKKLGLRAEGVIFNSSHAALEFKNQSDRKIAFYVFDPFSKSSQYVVDIEGSTYGQDVFRYPTIRLNAMPDYPSTYTNDTRISTTNKTTLFCWVKQKNPKSSKYKAALILVSQ